jgi:hypothetical protein
LYLKYLSGRPLTAARCWEVRPPEFRPAEVRLVEFRPAEVRPAKVRPAEVRIPEIWLEYGILHPPLIPWLDSFLKLREMFGIRQGAYLKCEDSVRFNNRPPHKFPHKTHLLSAYFA